jgi:hypothetical protein
MKTSDLMKYENKGTGVIIIWKERFLFVVGKKKFWNYDISPPVITFTNTGGHVNPGETVEEATKRETREELGCEVKLYTTTTSFSCELESSYIIQHQLKDKISPILIYNSSDMTMSVSAYLARISGKPVPSAEVPALILLPISLIQGGILKDLLNKGAILIEKQEGYIPRNAQFTPFGSAQIMVDHLEKFNTIQEFNKFIKMNVK